MNQRGFVNITIIIWIVVFAGVAGYFILKQQLDIPETDKQIRTFEECERAGYPVGESYPRQCWTSDGRHFNEKISQTSSPVPTLKPSPILTPAFNKCDVYPDENGSCPTGCVDYGVPLGCVTLEYMEECNSGKRICPICLAGDTLIDTPSGSISVKDLSVGVPVWTVDQDGNRVVGLITKTSKVPVPPTHQIVHLVLNDGREVFVSPGHSTIDGRMAGDLAVGDIYAGARVVTANRVVYGGEATYDILPSGATGFYWANDILLDSTLR